MNAFSTEIRYKGKEGKAALNAFTKKYSDAAKGIMSELPSNFSPVLANRIRKYFKENYISQQGWDNPNFSQYGAYIKDIMFKRGDMIQMGRFPEVRISHGSEVFGLRTGVMYNAVGGRDGSTYSKTVSVADNNVSINIKLGLNLDAFNGGSNIKDGETDTVTHTPGNALQEFSDRITGAGQKSVLITLTGGQKTELKSYMGSEIKKAIKAFRDRN
jgi:hypothetical protein